MVLLMKPEGKKSLGSQHFVHQTSGFDSPVSIVAQECGIVEDIQHRLFPILSLPFIDATIHCNTLYKMPILITATEKVATLSGVLFSNSKFFGLTVCYSFLKACNTTSGDTIQNPATSRDNNHEFAFDSDKEEELSKTDMSNAAITSQNR
jgi:hypothetical protein